MLVQGPSVETDAHYKRTDAPAISSLSMSGLGREDVSLQITGLSFRGKRRAVWTRESRDVQSDVTITGIFSADRKIIEELTVSYAQTWSGYGRKAETTWEFTACNIPHLSYTRSDNKREYRLSAPTPAKRPPAFSITRASYLETEFNGNLNKEGQVIGYEYRKDRFDATKASVSLGLLFY